MPGSPPSRQAEDGNTVGQIGSHQSFCCPSTGTVPGLESGDGLRIAQGHLQSTARSLHVRNPHLEGNVDGRGTGTH